MILWPSFFAHRRDHLEKPSAGSCFVSKMTPAELTSAIRAKRSLLCVGLDPDLSKMPPHIAQMKEPLWEFNRRLIDATAEYAVAYKPNTAFYEAYGAAGWEQLAKTEAHIPKGILKIADAKRGDIGNTSTMYAKAFFETMDFDAVTVAPYMGADSVLPFLQFKDKWVFLLALTSNTGASDFQWHGTEENPLYKSVIMTSLDWAKGQAGHLGFVTGATRPAHLAAIREWAPDNFFLVPGVGAQGGDLEAVCKNGMNPGGGILINSSRQIIYASQGQDFAEKAADEAKAIQLACNNFLG